jgi:hypothetical protein
MDSISQVFLMPVERRQGEGGGFGLAAVSHREFRRHDLLEVVADCATSTAAIIGVKHCKFSVATGAGLQRHAKMRWTAQSVPHARTECSWLFTNCCKQIVIMDVEYAGVHIDTGVTDCTTDGGLLVQVHFGGFSLKVC